MALYVRPRGEVVLAMPDPVKPVAHVKSTFVLGSIGGLKESGHYEAYVERLGEAERGGLLGAVPATWISLDLATAHYRVCESFGFPAGEAARRGRTALQRLGGTVYGTALQMARQAGATPWTMFPALQRFWSRAYDGGGVAVYKVGPKDARIDLLGCALCQVPYYRQALCGLLEGLTALFCGRIYLREARQPAGADSASYRAQWV